MEGDDGGGQREGEQRACRCACPSPGMSAGVVERGGGEMKVTESAHGHWPECRHRRQQQCCVSLLTTVTTDPQRAEV